MVCAFTGHRPQRLPWGSREADPRCQALKVLLGTVIDRAIASGCRTFLCGMALGCDTYFAEAVLEKKLQHPELTLEAVLPCPGQADRWNAEDRRRYEQLLLRCDRVTVLEPVYSDGCMFRRNQELVDRADLLISVYDGAGGGTGNTVQYARKCGVPILPVWL